MQRVTHLKFVLVAVSLFFLFSGFAFSQGNKQVQIENADTFEGDESLGKNVSRLLGNVIFKHNDALMYCDSAYLYQETNSLDAYGRIRIVQGDSINLTGDFLKYNGNTQIANLTGNVIMTDRSMVLKTPVLVYDLKSETAEYFSGGEITDNKNVLTSKKGYYLSTAQRVSFKDSVVLVNPNYRIETDTLQYLTVTETALFDGPARIYSAGSDSSVIYTEKGWYDTRSEKSVFTLNSYIVSKENRLSGDSLVYDNKLRFGKAFNNVTISDSIQKVLILGAYGFSDDLNKTAMVTDSAVMIRIFETDSMFLHADTLFAKEDTLTRNKIWMAYHGVRIFKTDLQGICDSLVYSSTDSTVSFYTEPVLWSEENQLTATHMVMQLANSEISELRLTGSAFICSQEDSLRYNQIKGRDMTGFFNENKLYRINVMGNGQSVYYSRNNKKQFTGVNRADCSDMLIQLLDNKISTISLLNDPDATLYPIDELSPGELRLKGFSWLEELRPLSKDDIFR